MKFSYEIEKDILTVSVEEREKCRYAAYLFLNKQVVERQYYREKARFEFKLQEEGMYKILLYEKNENSEIITEETEEFAYNRKIEVGMFSKIKYEAYGVTIRQLLNSSGSIGAGHIEKWEGVDAILIDLKDELDCIRNEFGNLICFVESKEREKVLFQKYFSLGRKFEEHYKGVCIIIDRFGNENESYFSDEEFYVLEIVYAALRQTLYRLYAISASYKETIEDILNESIEKIRDFSIKKEIDYDVLLNQRENVLEAKIISDTERNDQFFFYLIKDGRVIANSGWILESKYQWKVEETGVYCTQGYIKRNGYKSIRKSLPVYWSTTADRKEYEEFLYGEMIEEKELPYYEAEKPYCDFAVVTMNKEVELGSPFFKKGETKLSVVHEWENTEKRMLVITNGVPYEVKNRKLIFSGECIVQEKFVSGERDRDIVIKNSEKLCEAIGTFTALEFSEGECEVFTDYFGFGRLFYIQKDDTAIVSNRYDLILRIMRKMGIMRELHVDKIKVLLSTVSVQFLQQNIIREMNVRGIMQLLPEEKIEFNNGNWIKNKSTLGNDIAEFEIFHMCNYKRNLNDIAYEIKKNVGVIIKDNRFKNIIADLTGGLDSRVIYAALTNFPGISNRVRINTQDTPGSRDLELATKINNLYKIPWDSLVEEWQEKEVDKINEKQRSVFLGTYYAYGRNNKEILQSDLIRFSGGGGDFIARPYYSRKYFDTLASRLKDEERFIKYIENDYSANLIVDGKDFKEFETLIVNELKSNPIGYMTTLEKFNYLYFAYRNGFHFHNILGCKLNIPFFMPILSKRLYILNLQTHNLFKSVRLQIDVIETLNPLLNCIPFDGKTDEEDRKKKKAEENLNPIYSIEELPLCADYDKWQTSKKKKIENRKIIQKKDKILPCEELEKLYSNLRRLCFLCPELRSIGEALFFWIRKNEKSTRNIMFLSNKIQSILDEMI